MQSAIERANAAAANQKRTPNAKLAMQECQEHELLARQSSCVAFRVTASAFSRPAEASKNANEEKWR
jgi:hypothetical protein